MHTRVRVSSDTRDQLVDITDEVNQSLGGLRAGNGVVHLWCLHTTCGLTVNEGADPDVATDIVASMRGLVPRDADYRHAEGNSDSHVKTSLFGPGITLLVEDGLLLLGTWQRLFLAEWDGPRTRQIAIAYQPASG